jgi:hypothetical protein
MLKICGSNLFAQSFGRFKVLEEIWKENYSKENTRTYICYSGKSI